MSTTRRVKDIKHAGDQELNGRTVRSIRKNGTPSFDLVYRTYLGSGYYDEVTEHFELSGVPNEDANKMMQFLKKMGITSSEVSHDKLVELITEEIPNSTAIKIHEVFKEKMVR